MASAEISLDFLGSTPARLREELHGRVRVQALELLDCQGIDLDIGYKITGKLVHFENLLLEVKGEGFQLTAGSEFGKEFKVYLPERPMSFRGKVFSIAWFARVQVRLPWRIDLREEKEFTVLPAQAKQSRALQEEP